MVKETRDHYVPQFYLSRWAESNGMLVRCEKISATGKIHWKDVYPKEIAFERGLYGDLEETFFKPLDNSASKLLDLFENESYTLDRKIDIGDEKHRLWAKYILAQLVRVPANVEMMIKAYGEREVCKGTALDQLPSIIESEKAIREFRSFEWIFAKTNSERQLITCDNPVVFRPNNLSHSKCVIVLPLGPNSFFMACRKETLQLIEKNPAKLVSHINQEIIKNATGRIFMSRKSSLSERFVEKRLKAKT